MDPLFKSSAGKSKLDAILGDPAIVAAFQLTKEALSSATILVPLHPTAPTSLTTDASDCGIGAVHKQFSFDS